MESLRATAVAQCFTAEKKDYRMGCVIASHGKILGRNSNVNRTSLRGLPPNLRQHCKGCCSTHAEVATYLSLHRSLKTTFRKTKYCLLRRSSE